MSFNIIVLDKKVIVTFQNKINNKEITNAFISVVERANITEICCMYFDFMSIKSYTFQKYLLKSLKLITKFSISWNNDIKIIIISKNPIIKRITTLFINLDLKWEFYLFENIDNIPYCCGKKETIMQIKQAYVTK